MKYLILLLAIWANIPIVQAQTEKVLVKTIATTNSTNAIIDLPGEVAINEWEENTIRVTTYLNVPNMSENIVKQLLIVGRYTLEATTDETTQTVTITMPKMKGQVTVKGVQLVELLRFEVNAPAGYQIDIKTDDLPVEAAYSQGQAM